MLTRGELNHIARELAPIYRALRWKWEGGLHKIPEEDDISENIREKLKTIEADPEMISTSSGGITVKRVAEEGFKHIEIEFIGMHKVWNLDFNVREQLG